MAQLLDAMQAKYSNYSKLAAGRFRDLFRGQFFFDLARLYNKPHEAGAEHYLMSEHKYSVGKLSSSID